MGSDDKFVITKAELSLKSTGKKQEGTARYVESKVRIPDVRQQFKLELRNRFGILQTPARDDTIADDHQNSEQPDPTNNIEQTW